MSKNQHFGSISGGKDSQALLCLMVERAVKRGFGNMPPRFFFADTGNEHPLTIDHVAYLSDWLFGQLGLRIETVSAYDVPGLIDAEAFARKRIVIAEQWPLEKRRKRHHDLCDRKTGCDCPIQVSPPVDDATILAAIEALQPTGIAFLDMAMLHGRYPGVKVRFCTDELKLAPMQLRKVPLLNDRVSIIEWIGERADESAARAAKAAINRVRHSRAAQVLYRPLHQMTAADVFAISARHGLRPNPLYTMGMTRVGCMPCIMCKKGELRQIAQRFPDQIEKIRRWEAICGRVSRRTASGGSGTTFFAAKKIPGDKADETRAAIDKAVAWSRTHDGWTLDLVAEAERRAGDEDGWLCQSAYGLCE